MFQSKYKAVKNRRNVLFLILIALLIGITVIENLDFDKKEMLIKLLLGLIVFGIFFLFADYRCPKCDSFLGKNTSNNYCSKCGLKLQ